MESKLVCPKCGSENVARERRPDGDDICGSCHHKWPSKQSQQMEQSNKAREWEIQETATSILPPELRVAQRRFNGQVDASPYWTPVIEKSAYDALQAENRDLRKNIIFHRAEVERLSRLLAMKDSRASQFESMVTETMRVRDEALAECAKYREILKSVTTDIKQYSSAYHVVQWVLDRNEKARQALAACERIERGEP